MKIVKHVLFASTLASLMVSASALAGDADFTLLNRTGITLREIYISPANKNSWGNDRMGDSVLDNGKSRLFRFSDKSACKQDLKVVFDDDSGDVVWRNFDLCEIDKVTLKFNKNTRAATADIE
ncbi:hypothetical protein [Polaromonas sp. SM01]|uniref:hypothetical protein n=1 Tax=Polaromonas sp. SM01 TaxID=3085630 RepID=UPI00298293D5|nr:hypothetical protein [Polaromonas sp. SM01]MDW5442824.1 hypothetical protein [Polaromonas sp. SM01]